MAVPSGAQLVAQLHCLSTNGQYVITVQRWRDPAAAQNRPRSWLRLVRNGTWCEDRAFGGQRRQAEVEKVWEALAADYAPTQLTEAQMWTMLAERAGVGQIWCQRPGCSTALPVARWICPTCGQDARRVGSGSTLAARRRGVIVLRTGERNAS